MISPFILNKSAVAAVAGTLLLSLFLRAEEPKSQQNVATFDAAWQILQDSYFDPSFHGLDWNKVRAELRPKAEAARDVHELRAVLEEMLHRLGGSHMAIIPASLATTLHAPREKGAAQPETTASEPRVAAKEQTNTTATRDGDLGFEIRPGADGVLVTRVETNGPAELAGVRPGWVLTRIGERSVADILAEIPNSLQPEQAHFMRWSLLESELLGAPGSTASVSFLNAADERVVLQLKRAPIQGQPAKLGYLPTLYAKLEADSFPQPDGGQVGLLRFNLWMAPIISGLDEEVDQFRHAEGIIIDLRGNLGGIGGMILGFSGHFLNQRVSLGTLKMRDNELQFYTNPRRVAAGGKRVEPYSGPLAILIDGLSLSAAELFAGGMQAVGRARIFGERSGGQALPAVWDRLPNGDVLYHAFGDFVTAAGVRLEGRGVIPDVTVPLTRDDLLAGRDTPLLAALKWIREQQHSKESPSRAAN